MMTYRTAALGLLIAAAVASAADAFVAPFSSSSASVVPGSRRQLSGPKQPLKAMAAAVVPNPFKRLPWNVEKERKREARRFKLERASLHRELGIVEDASYEEIVMATDTLIARAGDDLKQKIRIEVAKDKILQIRLNERLAGLAEISKDAKAQSRAELEGPDDLDDQTKKNVEWNTPLWMRGLVVKPDEKHRNKQLKLWGGVTFLGWAFVPAQDYIGRFTWLICVAQLTFRGMPTEMMENGGLGISFGGGSGAKSHRKVAWLLGLTTWIVGASLVYGLMPTWAKGQRWTGTLGFTLQNLIFGLVCSYLQPYKG